MVGAEDPDRHGAPDATDEMDGDRSNRVVDVHPIDEEHGADHDDSSDEPDEHGGVDTDDVSTRRDADEAGQRTV